MTGFGLGPATPLAVRLRSTVALLLGLLLLVVGAAVALLLDVRALQDRVTRDYFTAVTLSDELFVRVLDLQSTTLTYVMTGAPEDLAALQELQQPAPGGRTADDLLPLLAEAPTASTRLAEARTNAQRWLALSSELVERVRATGPGSVSPAEVQAERAAFAEVRTAYRAYLDALAADRGREAERLRDRTELLVVVALLAGLTAAVTAAGVLVALRRWVTRPLLALGRETQVVRGGALDHEVAGQGPPEIRALAADVEEMRRRLVDQVAEAEAARAEVERGRAMLQAQADDLRRSNRDLEQFAYVASHDLQEPLRKVASFCQMLERRYSGQLDERADQYIAFAVDGAKRMQLLINDLLAFSRVGRMPGTVGDVRLDDVLADALRNLSTAVEESGAQVTADPLPVVPGERGLLVQLLQNLIANAVKFAGDGPPRVHVSARRDGDVWEVAVRDEGIGVEPQYAERIFVIFQRLHPKEAYPGTGIGLAMCKKIVEHHGGQIWLDQDTPTGAVFRFTLPVHSRVRADDELVGTTPRRTA